MPSETEPPQRNLKQIRTLLWILVALTAVGAAALLLVPRLTEGKPAIVTTTVAAANLGGPFTLTGADGRHFSSAALAGKPYAIFFGFTRCGDVCPTTLGRLVKLRQQAGGDDKFAIVFVTIDPAHDGPKEVGQFATAFHSPIIGLTGSPAEIDQVKKQFRVVGQPSHHPMPGMEMEHTATVLLFGRDGKLAATIAPDEPDSAALDKLRRITT